MISSMNYFDQYDVLKNFINIPDSWYIVKLKYLVKSFIGGGTPSTKDDNNYAPKNSGIPWVTISDMSAKRIKTTEKCITDKGKDEKNLRILPKGTILYSIYASLGKVSVLDIEATTNQAILGLIVNEKKVKPEYLMWWLRYLEPIVPMLASSNTQNNLNANKVKNLPILLPPSLDEQEKIISYLNLKMAIIDDLILKSIQIIKYLEEYKYSLINECITGQLNVSKI